MRRSSQRELAAGSRGAYIAGDVIPEELTEDCAVLLLDPGSM
jgi:hypothetical protein